MAIEARGGGTTTKRRGRPRKDPLADAPDWITGTKPTKKKGRRTFYRKTESGTRRPYEGVLGEEEEGSKVKVVPCSVLIGTS